MTKLFVLLGATIGGWIGWWVGDHVGLFTAFIVSIIGTGFGVWGARRVASNYLP